MDFTFLKTVLCRKEIKCLIIGGVTGGVLQILSRRYLKNHPEFLEENHTERQPATKNKNWKPHFLPPGGALIEITGVSLTIGKLVIKFLAKKGLIAGLTIGSGIALTKTEIPVTAISTYLRDAFPQNLPHLEKKRFVVIDKKKIYIGQCDQNLEYWFVVLKDPTIPFEEKERLTRLTFKKYLNLKTSDGRVNFVLCIVFILYILFSIENIASYHIILKNLIEAIKKGKIPKIVGRGILRKLKRKGLPIDPDLIEVVNS